MHVTVVADQLCARVPGGTGRYTQELALGLRRLGTPVRAVVGRLPAPEAGPDALADLRSAGASVDALNVPSPVLSRFWERGLPPRVAADAGGVVHAPTLLVPPVPADAPLVVTIHDVVPWTHPETLTPRGVAFHQRMAARTARRADVIITPTEAVARRVREILSPVGIVRAIPLGTTPLTVPSDAAARRVALGLQSRPYVLFVGTTEPRKGLDVLLRAMADAELAGLDLVLVGAQGWGEVDLPGLAASAGLTERLHLLGRISDDDLAAVYAGARVLAMPSRAEGFGIPVVEAMAHGIPVVTSDDPALVETGAGAALTAPVGDPVALADALATALGGGAALRERVERGRAHAASLTWDLAAERTLDAYAVAQDRRRR